MLSRVARSRNALIFNQMRFFGPKSKAASKTATGAKQGKKASPSKQKSQTPNVIQPAIKPIGSNQVPIVVKVIHNIIHLTVDLPSRGRVKFFVDKAQTIQDFIEMLQSEDPSIDTISSDIQLPNK